MLKLAVLPPSLSYQSLGRFIEELSKRQIAFDWLDFFLVAALGFLTAALLVLERRSARVTLFLSYALSNKLRAILFFTLCALVATRYYFSPGGLSWGGDAPQHILYTEITRQIISSGEWPIWTNALGTGSPYTQFYGFLFFYLTALISICTDSLSLSIKVVLAASQILSGLGVFALVSQLTRSRKAGFFSGLVYILCVWHVQHIIVMGRLPLSLFYALLPWPFYFFERARKGKLWVNSLSSSLILGLLAFTHPGYAFWAIVLYSLYALGRIIQPSSFRLSYLYSALISLFIGLISGSYLTLGMWVEKGYTGLSEGFELAGPMPSLWHLLVWSNYRFWLIPPQETFHWYGGYLGISAVLISFYAFLSCLFRKRSRLTWLPLWLPFILTIVLVFAHDIPPIRFIPVIQAFPPARYLLFLTFFLALAAGLGFHLIELRARHIKYHRAFFIILAVLLLDLGTTTFQQVYSHKPYPIAYNDLHFQTIRELGTPYTNQGQLPTYRHLYSRGSLPPYFAVSWPYFSTHIPSPLTVHPGDLSSGRDFSGPFERLVNDAFASLNKSDLFSITEKPDMLTPQIRDGLRMLNVHVLTSTQPDGNSFSTTWEHSPIISSSHASPYRADRVKAHFNKQEILDKAKHLMPTVEPNDILDVVLMGWLIEQTQISEDGKRCKQILIRDLDKAIELPTKATVELLEHKVTHTRVDIHLSASDSAFVRLAYSYFPHLSVRVDGHRIQPYETAGHFMAFPIGKGQHHIELVAELSPLRRWLLAAHILLWIATVLFWIREWRSK